jgi:hypothetical protein
VVDGCVMSWAAVLAVIAQRNAKMANPKLIVVRLDCLMVVSFY